MSGRDESSFCNPLAEAKRRHPLVGMVTWWAVLQTDHGTGTFFFRRHLEATHISLYQALSILFIACWRRGNVVSRVILC